MTYEELWRRISAVYDAGEAKAIARLVLDERFGLSVADVYCGKVTQLSSDEQAELEKMVQRLERMEPVQYVLGSASFCDRQFHVEPGVLIPRPETEELCHWISQTVTSLSRPYILDIGTGSGCIATTLSLEIKDAEVTAWDISSEAMRIASFNAERLCANVSFVCQDALHVPADLEKWSVIVSNPPYICEKEKSAMYSNVLDHEPSLALFVPDDDPLRFYRSISEYGVKALKKDGMLFFEINPLYAEDMVAMLEAMRYADVEVRNDQFGKQRFIKAIKK
jgi:release factor glutamine methyltransferase